MANNYGNLCQRVFSFVEKIVQIKFQSQRNLIKKIMILLKKITEDLDSLIKDMNNQELNSYLKKLLIIRLMQINISMISTLDFEK